MDQETFAKKFYFDELGRRADEAMAAKVSAGLPSGRVPLGYLKNGNKVELERQKARKIRRAFFMTRDGASLRSVLQWLQEEGFQAISGKALALSSLQSMLTNPFYCGLVRYGGKLHQGSHEAMVSKTLFDSVQRSLRKRRC